MKKLVALLFALLLCFTCALAEKLEPAEPALVAATDVAQFNGIWGAGSMVYQGARYPISMAGITSSMEINNGIVTYQLNDGQVIWETKLEQGVLKCGQGENQVIIALHESNLASVTMPNGTFFYERFELTPMEAPAAIEAESIAQFNGSWGDSFAVNEGIRYSTRMVGLSVTMKIDNGTAAIDMGGSAAEFAMNFEKGVLTMSDDTTAMTITLHEGDVISLVMNGSAPVYCQWIAQ